MRWSTLLPHDGEENPTMSDPQQREVRSGWGRARRIHVGGRRLVAADPMVIAVTHWIHWSRATCLEKEGLPPALSRREVQGQPDLAGSDRAAAVGLPGHLGMMNRAAMRGSAWTVVALVALGIGGGWAGRRRSTDGGATPGRQKQVEVEDGPGGRWGSWGRAEWDGAGEVGYSSEA